MKTMFLWSFGLGNRKISSSHRCMSRALSPTSTYLVFWKSKYSLCTSSFYALLGLCFLSRSCHSWWQNNLMVPYRLLIRLAYYVDFAGSSGCGWFWGSQVCTGSYCPAYQPPCNMGWPVSDNLETRFRFVILLKFTREMERSIYCEPCLLSFDTQWTPKGPL